LLVFKDEVNDQKLRKQMVPEAENASLR